MLVAARIEPASLILRSTKEENWRIERGFDSPVCKPSASFF
jgi:hypothetical protein